MVLLSGEPGIGKTRLAEEVAMRAAAAGADVLWGRCDETEGAPAFWPWIQVVRLLTARGDPAAVAAALGAGAGDVAQIVPEVKEVVPGLEPPAALDPDAARFRLYDSVSRFLSRLARGRPVVLLLDDLHWADVPSLQLLCFLTRQLDDAPLLALATYRDADVGPGHPLRAVLAQLVREPRVRRIGLAGLCEQDVARFLADATGDSPPDDVVAELHARTEGNPFFLGELVRLLESERDLRPAAGAAAPAVLREVPAGIRDVILRRVAHLPPAATRLLTVAAVIGREFDLDVLAKVGETAEDEALDVVEAALATRIVVESADSVGRYRFSHALVRETLYGELSAIRRARLHGRVGLALEELGGVRRAQLAELAHHFFVASSAGSHAAKAAEYAQRAAEAATAQLAYEEAVCQCQRAVEAHDAVPADDGRRHCELLLALGDARWRAGEVARARETFLEAAEQAGSFGNAELLARAVLGFGGGLFRDWHATRGGAYKGRLLSLLERALDGVGDGDSPLRVRLLGHLAEELLWTGQDERRARLSREAVEMARRLGNPEALAAALCSRCLTVWSPDHLDERLAVCAEIVELAEAMGSRELALFGHHYLFVAQLETGDTDAAGATLDRFELLAEELRQPLYLWEARWLRALQALMHGRFADAERLAFEALDIGQRAQDPDALAVFGVQVGCVRLEQGRAAEMEPSIRAFVAQYPETPTWRAALCLLLAERGDAPAALAELDDLAVDDFAAFPRNFAWLSALAMLSDACALLGDRARAAVLHDQLLPFADRVILTSDRNCWGSTSHWLGVLETTMGRFDEATERLATAKARHERMGARPWVAHSAAEQARALLARRAAGDAERAERLLDEAGTLAAELGMERLAARVAALRGPADRAPVGRR